MRKISLLLLCFLFIGVTSNADPIRNLLRRTGGSSTFPNADKVLVFDSTRVDMEETGLSHYYMHQLYKILNEKAAKEMSTFTYGYDPLSAFAQIEKIIIYRANGTNDTISSDAEMDYPAPAGTIMWGAREKMIHLGALEAGDGIEIFVYKKGFTYALLDDEKYIPPMKGHFYDIIPFYANDPVLRKVYEVDIPKDKEVNFKIYKGNARHFKKYLGDKIRYHFSMYNMMPFQGESNMVSLSDVAPKVLISTAPDWYSKSKWFYGVNEDYGSFEANEEIREKVDEILMGAENEMDSISLLTHWVADYIRYFGLSMGEGEGFTLHKGPMTYTDRCGVCKDKAGMLVCMLRAAGFEAYAAMTMAGSRIEYIPADQFNHSVACVKKSDGEYMMLDPTWVPFVRELWSSAEQQQNYLIGLPEGDDLRETPISDPQNHYIKIKAKSSIEENGSLSGSIELIAEGQSDSRFRGMFTGSRKNSWTQNMENEILSVFPQAQIVQMNRPKDPYNVLEGPIKLSFQVIIPDYALVEDEEIIFKPLLSSSLFRRGMTHLNLDISQPEKKYPFRDACSHQFEFEEEIDLPSFTETVYMPEITQSTGSGASFNGGYLFNNNKLTYRISGVFNKRIYQASDWPSFREAVIAHKNFMEEPIILKK